MENIGIPRTLKEIYFLLRNEIIFLNIKWTTYLQLFKEENVTILNEFAGYTAYLIQKTFITDIYLTICRITDNTEVMGFENICLGQLIAKLDGTGYKEIQEQLEIRLIEIKKKVVPLRIHRNKILSHSDSEIYLKGTKLPSIFKSNIDNILKDLLEFLNLFFRYFEKISDNFDIPPINGNGDDLIYALRDAKQYRYLKKQKNH